jgi:hypothetical protein
VGSALCLAAHCRGPMSPSLGRGYKPMVTAAASAALGNVASLWRDSEPASGGSYRSDDLCASAAPEPRPYRAFFSGRVASVRPDSATRKSPLSCWTGAFVLIAGEETPALAWSRPAFAVRLLRGMHEVSIEQRQFGLIWRLELDPGFVEQLS